MEIKFDRIKTYSPDLEVSESGHQLTFSYQLVFDGADFSEEFLNSEYPKDYPDDPEEAFEEWENEFSKVTLPKIFKEKLNQFLKVDEIPGYVDSEIEVSLYGHRPEDAKSMRGSLEVKVWVDLQTSKISDGVNLFIESLRK